MQNELIFYTNPMSRGRIVRWMLEEIAAEYETVVLEYGTTMKAAEFLAVNPMGKVPALKHNQHIVTETAAICVYLADAFPDAGLAPPQFARAQYYRWLFYFAGAVEAAVINHSLELQIPKEKEVMLGYGNFSTVMDVIEQHVTANPYIAGEQFSAADVYCGSQIGWGLQFGSMDKRPAFAAYWDRVMERPAKLRADALDDALMPEQES